MSHVSRGQVVFRGAGATAMAVLVAAVVLALGTPAAGITGIPALGLTAQFGVSAYSAGVIVDALNSWWATALSLALVPLGLGAAALTIRAVWTTLVNTIGRTAARRSMVAF